MDVSFGKAFFKTLPVYNTSRHKSAYLNFRKITRCRGICSVSCRSHHHARLQGFKDDGPSIEAISAGLSLIEAIVPPTKPRRKSSSFETPGSIKTETVFSIFLFMYYARHWCAGASEEARNEVEWRVGSVLTCVTKPLLGVTCSSTNLASFMSHWPATKSTSTDMSKSDDCVFSSCCSCLLLQELLQSCSCTGGCVD